VLLFDNERFTKLNLQPISAEGKPATQELQIAPKKRVTQKGLTAETP